MSDRAVTDSKVSGSIAPIEEVVVIGTGFIGLPLALLLAYNETDVVGVDIDENLVEAINDGTLNLDEAVLQRILDHETTDAHLEASTEPREADAFVISVPTPIEDPQKSPDLSHIEEAIDSVLPYLEPGDLLNVESTIPPLTCENRIVPKLDDAGLTPGEDVQLAHSPERILPGNVFTEIRQNDRIIGGIDDRSRRRAAALYEPFLQGEVYYTDLRSAELCKLMENTFRDVNVALANEFALIGDELGVDMVDVIELANNHTRVDILHPGIGVGGHCLPVDPWFLNEVDPEHTNLITTARRINDMMPAVAAKKIRRAVSDYTDPTILTLGLAYKPETQDARRSPAMDVVEELRLDGYDVRPYDRLIDGYRYDSLEKLLDTERPDVVVTLVEHETTMAEVNRLKDHFEEKSVKCFQFRGNQLVLV